LFFVKKCQISSPKKILSQLGFDFFKTNSIYYYR